MSNTIFDANHIFIVFGLGSGGNFLVGLLTKLTNADLTKTDFSNAGSAHNVSNRKHLGEDSLSFGTIPEEKSQFKSEIDREHYYLRKINDEYVNISSPQVVWTHDFTNIPIYKKYFKKSQILIITHDSYSSRLTSICMQATKIFLDPSITIPIREPYKSSIIRMWEHDVKDSMSVYLNPKLVEDIFNKRETDQRSKDIITYFTVSWLINSFGMSDLANGLDSSETCIYDFALYPNPNWSVDDKRTLIIGENYYDYTDQCNVALSYSYLIKNKPTLLFDAIEKIVNKTLSLEEKRFVLQEYETYRQAQNKDILEDPIKYYQSIQRIAIDHIKKINL